MTGTEPATSENIKLGFLGIAQEAISNTRKLAKTDDAKIKLQFKYKYAGTSQVD